METPEAKAKEPEAKSGAPAEPVNELDNCSNEKAMREWSKLRKAFRARQCDQRTS